MTFRVKSSGRTTSRAIAMFGAVLLLVSQVVAVAHFHESAASRDGVASAALSVDPGFCPVCQLALHSPGSVTAATTVARGPSIAGTILLVAPISSESPVFSAARGRAPPVSL